MDAIEFDVIPFEDIKGKWKKLGAGSFGNVYKASYLGIEVAIKEVLPSDDYDVAKYFEREWRLMKEARHPNVVLYIALSRAPQPDNRIFIISEFIENGNLRQYIYDKKRPFPWRLRLSFATDIVRAMAYLHARQCIHRDLKPENLLITANGRIKVTDFGFARIAAQTVEETRRLTFCGTDSYMSPEVLIGDSFGLETDVFSLGIIFCEIAARKLADDDTFKRVAPHYELDTRELYRLADSEAPPAFLQLVIDCCARQQSSRPTMRQVLERLQAIEQELIQKSISKGAHDPHVGSIKFLGTKDNAAAGANKPSPGLAINIPAANVRPVANNRRIPSFGMGVAVGKAGTPGQVANNPVVALVANGPPPVLAPPGGTGPLRPGVGGYPVLSPSSEEPSEDEEDEEIEAILALNGVDIREGSKIIPQLPKTSPALTAKSDMSWRFTGWMKEYKDKIMPGVSQTTNGHEPAAASPASLSPSAESELARAPLLPANGETEAGTTGNAMEVDDAENASSVLTIRQSPLGASNQDISSAAAAATTSEASPANAKPTPEAQGRRSNHRREPNDLVVPPSAPLSTVMSEAEKEREPTESYYTAVTQSAFRAPTDSVDAVLSVAVPTQPHLEVTPAPPLPPRPAPPVVLADPISRPTTPPPSMPAPLESIAAVELRHFGVAPRMHRFSLVKSGNAKRVTANGGASSNGGFVETSTSYLGGWSPFELLFGSALGLGIGNKCDLCGKRLGWKPCLECDDCGLTCHMKCGELAPLDCQERQDYRAAIIASRPKTPPKSGSPARSISPKPHTPSPKMKNARPHK